MNRLLAVSIAVAFAAVVPSPHADAADATPGASAQAQTWAAWGGTVGIRWNRELAGDIGLGLGEARSVLDGLSWREHERFELRRSGSLEFHVVSGSLAAFAGGSVQARGGYVIATGGGDIDLTDFRLRPREHDPLILDIVGADGKAWFYIDRLMYELVDDNKVLAVRTMDLRISRDLAVRLGHPEVADWAIADMEMSTEVQRQGANPQQPAGGYRWHGTASSGGTYQADLFMQTFGTQYSRCDGCTGEGGNGRVVFTPSSTLKNNVNNGTSQATIPGDPRGTSAALWSADIPWFGKFSGIFAPYNNDQHPYLIWNLYRFNADGTIDQIGRSGVKHAFLTTNTGCIQNPGNNHVLGLGCTDTYGTGNNDSSSDLGPRSEIIPATNQWGRCGSIYDTNCDGVQNAGGNSQYDQRLVVRESQFSGPAQAGATYQFESWYLARQDIDIYNSMASKRATFTRNSTSWSVGANDQYRLGPVIDRWVDPANPGANARSVELAGTEGHTKVAVKATDLGNGSWRYDYVVMNLDFARAKTSGAEPNLRVIHNFGFDRFGVPVPAGTTLTNVVFSDGDLDAANDWTFSSDGGVATWTAPVNPAPIADVPAVLNPLNWGTMFRFSFVAPVSPGEVTASLRVAEAGTPAAYDAGVLAPVAPLPDPIFVDGFESAP